MVVVGAVISGLCLCVPAFWPSQWSMLVAVGGAGFGHAMIRDTQVAIALEIAEYELAGIGANAVLGSLRTLERGGSIAGLICIALLSSFTDLSTAIGAVAVWVIAGAAMFAFGMALSRRATRIHAQ